jgi:hypothetical protein
MAHSTPHGKASAMSEKLFKMELRDVASRIYVDLVLRTVDVSGSGVKVASSPEALAKLSFKLAQVFETVLDDLNAGNLPKNPDFKLGNDDIAAWLK